MDAANWSRHDVVIVGARVAGSAPTLLLARLGYDVAVADRATFPSDTPP
jgi:flavin-dependent dehydrogenase